MQGNLRRALALVRRRTPTGAPLVVELLEKAGCHLCEETFAALVRIHDRRRPLAIQRTQTAADGYVLRIPVLRIGEAELDAAGLTEQAIARWIEECAAR